MSQVIYSGDKAYKNIKGILEKLSVKKYMLVCGKSIDKMPVMEYLDSIGIEYVRFGGFTPNPKYEEVCDGVNLFRETECEAILAIGGGSPIDVAKCIKLYAKMGECECYLDEECFDSKIPLIAMPTTAGTGSESTRFSVIYKNDEKQSVHHDSIVPDYAILDADVLKSLPVYQKKSTVLDALCQAIESWWSVFSTEESKALAKEAVCLIWKSLYDYTGDSPDKTFEDIMKGSNLAGQAINITATTAPHAMCYKITTRYGLTHGHAVALCLPEVWEFMLKNPEKCTDKRGYEYLYEIFEEIAKALGAKNAEEAPEVFRGMIERLGMEYPKSENRDADLIKLVGSVNVGRLSNNPVGPTREDLFEMYEKIVK